MNKYVFSLGYGKLLMKKNEVVMVGNRVGQGGGGGLHLIQCLLCVCLIRGQVCYHTLQRYIQSIYFFPNISYNHTLF